MDLHQLQTQLKSVLDAREDMSAEERNFLLEHVGLFSEDELQQLILNNQQNA